METSLRQLNTDYIDLLYLHLWDFTTPVEEILRGMDDLVRQGKVLYVAISNSPAWQVSRMQAIADLRGWSPLVALQIEYNLIERTGERDLIPMAREMGLGVIPWSPLAGGVLTGKYSRADLTAADGEGIEGGEGAEGAEGAEGNAVTADGTRRSVTIASGALTERSLAIVDVVKEVAAELGRTPAQTGLAWTLQNPDVTAPVIGARTAAQLEDNLGALEIGFTAAQLARLDEAGAIELGFPHDVLARDTTRALTRGDLRIEPRR